MSKAIKAMYEKGVLKPEKPLNLKEGEVVTLIVKRDLSKYLGILGEASSEELEELEGEPSSKTFPLEYSDEHHKGM